MFDPHGELRQATVAEHIQLAVVAKVLVFKRHEPQSSASPRQVSPKSFSQDAIHRHFHRLRWCQDDCWTHLLSHFSLSHLVAHSLNQVDVLIDAEALCPLRLANRVTANSPSDRVAPSFASAQSFLNLADPLFDHCLVQVQDHSRFTYNSMVIFHSYVNVYQRVCQIT